MHEVGIMENTLAMAVKRAAEEGAHRIHRLTMRIGPLSGVVPEALEFAFVVLARGTIAEGARLEVERIPVDAGIPELPQMAKQLSIPFPKTIRILAVEVTDPYQIREGLSTAVTQALPGLVTRAQQVLQSWLPASTCDSR